MAIYPDKKGTQLTGRFRVELQKGQERYRKRFDTHKEAVEAEKAVLAAWARGEALEGAKASVGLPEVHSFATVIPLAQGKLWAGNPGEDTSWAHINRIASILGAGTSLDAVDTLKVDKVITALSKLGKSDATVNRYLSHLRTFLGWAKGRKYRTVPIDDISFDWKKESPGRIRWITAAEELAIQEYLVSRGRPEAEAVWDLIDIAIRTGCRRDELLTAELEQINGTRLHLWETKTDTPRTVPMTQETTAKLVRLIAEGRMPTRRGLRSWWQRLRAHMGLMDDENFVFHACRHTCATRMVDAGINVFVIKEWMGHKRIETTLRYAHVKPQNLEDALVAVGNYALHGGQKPQFSVVPSAPHALPTGGGNSPFTQSPGHSTEPLHREAA